MECGMKGFLSFIVLRMISRREMCGDEIRRELSQRRGSMPSPGTIYPVLKELRAKGLIAELEVENRMKRYRITEKGRKEADLATKQFVALFADLKEEFGKA